ncbi:MAG: hypothetical protein OXH59_09995, partial [Rhodospirillaceae bacterium]|nr:hypothetical protein [Rhodospirillaceae bacterium]
VWREGILDLSKAPLPVMGDSPDSMMACQAATLPARAAAGQAARVAQAAGCRDVMICHVLSWSVMSGRRRAAPLTRHFDRSEASGEIRLATEAGQALAPWVSTVRGPDFSTPPRIKSGAPVEMTGRGGGAIRHEMS